MLEVRPDIYKISDAVNQIQKNFMEDVSEDTLTMSTYGYMNEVFSNAIQNGIMMASEWGNEAFPIKTKFEKNILTNAITYDVKNINAVPAQMKIMLGFIESDIQPFFEKDNFRIAKDCSIFIGEYEFRLDYDILLTKTEVNGKPVYAARYDIDRINPISNITNPYLQPPILLSINRDDFVFITCTIRQVTEEVIQKKIVSNNILENKTIDFKFTEQLASFDVIIDEGNKQTYLTPIFEGMPLAGKEKYCYYNYLDKNTIRIKFAKESYQPKLNCEVLINLKNTKGSKGNFIYKEDIIISLTSQRINYRGLNALMKPLSSSTNGIDRKSIKDLKEIIPKEILARGSIINNKDLENYFNTLDNNNKLKFYRRRDNQIERLYYAYMLVKDSNENVIPTNTINLELKESDFDSIYDNRCNLNPGAIINYIPGNRGVVVKPDKLDKILEESNSFTYSSPFTLIVNKNPLSISYYLNEINRYYDFKFSYINTNSTMQFIGTNLECYKNYISGKNYKLKVRVVQNMNINKNLIDTDKDGNIISTKIKPALVIHSGLYNYYVYGEIVNFEAATYSYDIEFTLDTDNEINRHNQIRINDVYLAGTNIKTHVFLDSKVDMSVYMFAQFVEEYGIGNASTIFPTNDIQGYTLCNIYDTSSQVDLFYNYSSVIKSKVRVFPGETGENIYRIEEVPLVRYSYLNDEERCNNVIDYVQYRKIYIDNALSVIENSFSVDLKYFNTYGPSKMFNIGYNGELLDKVNLKLTFRLKLFTGSDKYTKDNVIKEIKSYVENINNINEIHMTNLTTDISNKFKNDIAFIEFVSINDYDSSYQYITKHETGIIGDVPEFLNIDLSEDLKPNIEIILV